MNADLQGLLAYFKHRNATGIMKSDKGHSLSDKEAKAYVRWGVKKGYKLLKEMPEFEDVKDQLNLEAK